MNNALEIFSYDQVPGELRRYPLFGHGVACGFPSPADDYLEKSLSLDELLVKNPNSTFFVRAQGESMYPLINCGDLLVVDRSLEAGHNRIVLAIVDGEFTVKRLIQNSHGTVLRAENRKFQDIVINDDREFEIWGAVTNIIHSAY